MVMAELWFIRMHLLGDKLMLGYVETMYAHHGACGPLLDELRNRIELVSD